jgi:tetratricopeptide (TPR) repeat protein
MDSLTSAAARALAAGDPLGALKCVALREDPPALALRGIAMAQLGEHPRARELLRRAARGFGRHEALAQARCVVAEAEVALAMRDLSGSPIALLAAAATLQERGDHGNALQARLIVVRRWLLLGRLHTATAALAPLDTRGHTPALAAVAELSRAELNLRSLNTAAAQAALGRAQAAAERAAVPALLAEVAGARAVLGHPAARRVVACIETPLRLAEVEALLGSGVLVLDACRRGLRAGASAWPLARRPVLFALALALAEAWPSDVEREVLIERVFRTRDADETHRARLRVAHWSRPWPASMPVHAASCSGRWRGAKWWWCCHR